MSVQIEQNGDYLYTLTEPVTAPAFTISAWFKTHDVTNNWVMCAIDTPDVAGYNILGAVEASGQVASDPIRCYTYNGTDYGIAVTTAGYSQDTWTHACMVGSAIDNRAALIDGGNKGTNSDSRTATPSELIIHGRRRNSRVGIVYDFGSSDYTYIAEIAVWNKALSDEQVASLAGGAVPTSIEAGNLIAYWPLYEDSTDSVGSNDLTEVDAGAGSLTFNTGEHPSISGETVNIAGVIAGASNTSGAITLFNEVSILGVIASTSVVGGALGTELVLSSNWQTDNFKAIKRLIAIGNDSLYYEDI